MKQTMPARRLQLSLIPAPLWKRNIRTAMGKKRWLKLRALLLTGHGLACDICNADVADLSKLQGHEQWSYIEKKRGPSITKLGGISFICALCHDAEHFGRIGRLQMEGKITETRVQQIIQHYCRVNAVSRAQFDKDLALAHEEHRRRSQLEWLIDWGTHQEHVEKA